MTVELKIKAKHLALEPAIIKKEIVNLRRQLDRMVSRVEKWDRKCGQTLSKIESLDHHNRHVVAVEARATHLARAFLRGQEYNLVEKSRKEGKEATFRIHVVPRVLKMVAKYKPRGTTISESDVKAWLGM